MVDRDEIAEDMQSKIDALARTVQTLYCMFAVNCVLAAIAVVVLLVRTS